jgi:electron transfer flavoprotein alpha subunit
MERILVLIHTDESHLIPKAAFESIHAAKQMLADLGSGSLQVGLVGDSVQEAANQIGGCGAERILAVSGAEFSQARYSSDSAAIEALCKAAEPTLVFAPATSRWSRVMSGVSYRLGGKIDTHATGLSAANGAPQVERWYYRQRMAARIQRAERPWFVTLDPGVFEAWKGESATASVETVTATPRGAVQRTEVTGVKAPPADEQTIRPEAELIFVAGAGWTKKQGDGQIHIGDAEKLILGFLHGAKASLGSSKSLVDLSGEGQAVLSFLSHLNQVGQTGATPRHPKGLATCCHGEEPHVVGWRFINERRAVNLDANCGWAHGKTDVLYVADAFKVMEKVNELLGRT